MSANPILRPIPALPGGRDSLPLTRASALERWRGGLVLAVAAQAMVVAAATLRHLGNAAPSEGSAGDMVLFWVLGVTALPLLLLGATTFAEKRLLTRPPKKLLAFHCGVFLCGSGLATAAVLGELGGGDAPGELIAVAAAFLLLSFLSLGAWFGATLLTLPDE